MPYIEILSYMTWKRFPRYWSFLRKIHQWIPLTEGLVTQSVDVFVGVILNKILTNIAVRLNIILFNIS